MACWAGTAAIVSPLPFFVFDFGARPKACSKFARAKYARLPAAMMLAGGQCFNYDEKHCSKFQDFGRLVPAGRVAYSVAGRSVGSAVGLLRPATGEPTPKRRPRRPKRRGGPGLN